MKLIREFTEEEIARMAKQLKIIFAARKEEKDKRPYKPHKRFDTKSCWWDTAKVVLQLDADPLDYIEAQFKFAKSTVFANTLHTEKAKARYRKLLAVRQHQRGEEISFKSNPVPREAELQELIADELHLLTFRYGSSDLTDPIVRSKVLSMHISHDPLIMMLLNPTPGFQEVFGEAAKERLEEYPHLRLAAAELGFNIALELIDEA